MAKSRLHPHGTPSRSMLRIWLGHHRASAVSGLARLLRKPGAALLLLSAMALTMSLPLGLWLTLSNLEHLSGSVQHSRAVDLFLPADMPDARIQVLAEQVRAWPGVTSVEHQAPDEGLAELRARGGWDEITDLLADDNPLPHRLRVMPTEDAPPPLLDALAALEGVELIQHDAQWRQRLEGWLEVGRRLVWVLSVLFGLGSVLVVGNSVRLELQLRSEEMHVLHLIGASNGFIRRPFLYLGAWYGLIGGMLAIAAVTAAVVSLHAPVAMLAASYESPFVLHGLTPAEGLSILAGSTTLGWLGAGLVSRNVLRQAQVK